MNCPDCQRPLEKTTFKVEEKNLGFNIVYCVWCGGFWLESLTVNNLKVAEVEKLEKLIKIKAINQFYLGGDKICPQCQQPLERLEAESIPATVFIYQCQKCQKKWFPGGQLLEFKKAQSSKLAYLKQWKIPLGSIFAILLPMIVLLVMPVMKRLLKPKPAPIYLQQPQEESLNENLIESEPSVVALGEGKVEISFTTKKEVISDLEYGQNQENLTKIMISSTPETFHKIILYNLEAGKRYVYRINLEFEGQKTTLPLASFAVR